MATIKRRKAQIGLVAAIVLLLACFSVLFIQGSASANSHEQEPQVNGKL